MSRSFKKHPGWCDRNPWAKKQANGIVRKYKHLVNGNMYKKVFCSWEIHDYKSLIWDKMDLRWADRDADWWRKPPQKVKCLKELMKTKDYIHARMK